jgi:hypothetical protein
MHPPLMFSKMLAFSRKIESMFGRLYPALRHDFRQTPGHVVGCALHSSAETAPGAGKRISGKRADVHLARE